jgi:hypothetical protein
MLSTINGLDLLLVIIITILGFKVYNLTRECESYVGQIMELAQELNEIHYYKYESLKDRWGKPDPRDNLCVYCTEIERRVTGDECLCDAYDGQVTKPTSSTKCMSLYFANCNCGECDDTLHSLNCFCKDCDF